MLLLYVNPSMTRFVPYGRYGDDTRSRCTKNP